MRVLITAAWLVLTFGASARAQELPSRVRVLRPSCEGPIAWAALEDAVRVELRSMGSDLDRDEAGEVPARLVLDARCVRDAQRVTVTLVHTPSGRSITEQVELGAEGDRVRVLAVGLSELLRSRWAGLLVDPAPPEPPPSDVPEAPIVARVEIDRSMVRAEVAQALADREAPEPARVPGAFIDLAAGVSAYPAATHATLDLRAGGSIPATDLARVALEVTGAIGAAGDPLGDVRLYGVGLGAAIRLAHVSPELVVEAGPRLDVGWTHAEGVPDDSDAVAGAGLDALHLAAGLDLRLRVPITTSVWVVTAAEVGYSLVGIDARADERRVTAQTGPRAALCIGVALVP